MSSSIQVRIRLGVPADFGLILARGFRRRRLMQAGHLSKASSAPEPLNYRYYRWSSVARAGHDGMG